MDILLRVWSMEYTSLGSWLATWTLWLKMCLFFGTNSNGLNSNSFRNIMKGLSTVKEIKFDILTFNIKWIYLIKI